MRKLVITPNGCYYLYAADASTEEEQLSSDWDDFQDDDDGDDLDND
ncbi:MAG: hypothetical protein PHP00_06770 [Thiotrichaceae bacterium]|nr:hypothetical protein [Thiotrichaceae bacterium]